MYDINLTNNKYFVLFLNSELVYLQRKQYSGQMYDSIIQLFTRTKKTRTCLTGHPLYVLIFIAADLQKEKIDFPLKYVN